MLSLLECEICLEGKDKKPVWEGCSCPVLFPSLMGMDLALDVSSTLSWQIFSLDETSFRAEFGNHLRLGFFFAYGMFMYSRRHVNLLWPWILQHKATFVSSQVWRFLSSETSGLHPILQRHLMCSVDGAAHCLVVRSRACSECCSGWI